MEFDNLYDEYQMKKMKKMKKSKGGSLGQSLLNLGSQIRTDLTPLASRVMADTRRIRAERQAQADERAALQAQISALGGSALFDRLRDVGSELGNTYNSLSSSLSEASRRGRQIQLDRAAREQALAADTVALRARLAALQGRGRKTKGGVLGIPNMGILNRLRGQIHIPGEVPFVADHNNEDIDHRLFQQMVQNHPANMRAEEPFEMIGREEIDNAVMANLQRQQAINRQQNPGIEMRGQGASGGFLDPMNLMNAYLSSRNSSNPAASMAARAVLGSILPSSLANMGLSAVGLGKNKEAKGGFILPLMAAQAMGLNPIGAIRGLVGFGKNRKDVLFYPKDEATGGFLSPMMLMTLATMAPSILKNVPIGAILGSGKKFKFQFNEELLKKLEGVKGGASAQYYRNLASGVSNGLGLASGLSGALSFTPLAPIAAPMAATLGAISGILKAASTIGAGDPREYRRPSHSARKEHLQLANMRGIETSDAKGGYVHRPTKMHGGAMSGNMRAVGGARSERAAIVKNVMNERGVGLIEASKIVKNEGLY
jgi:hypothetical protein